MRSKHHQAKNTEKKNRLGYQKELQDPVSNEEFIGEEADWSVDISQVNPSQIKKYEKRKQ